MEINNRIVELKKQLHKISSTKEYMVKLENYRKENEDSLQRAETVFKKEHKDVEKLKKMSLTSILTHFKHDKEEILAKEEQEEIQAAFHLKQLQADQETIENDYKRCKREIQQEESIKKELEEYLYQRATSDRNVAEDVRTLRDSIESIQQEEKEISEAMDAGNIVLEEVQLALHDLSGASTWGTIDILGGGFMTTMMKHNNLNNAQRRISNTRNNILRFEKELQDVKEYALVDSQISLGLGLADYIFDNIFTDFFVQSKIKNSQESVTSLANSIEEILSNLKKDKVKCEKRKAQLLKEYRDIINKE